MGCGSSKSQAVSDPLLQEESDPAALQIVQKAEDESPSTDNLRSVASVCSRTLSGSPHAPVPGSAEDNDERSYTLTVTVLSAQALRAADSSFIGKGSSDPYCTCTILGKPESSVSTKHISKNCNPVWDEVLEIDDYFPGETLEFTVWDYDKVGSDDLLGRAVLQGSAFFEQGAFTGELKLQAGRDSASQKAARKAELGDLTIKVEVQQPRPAALPVSVPGSRLRVVMVSASDLRAADWSLMSKGASDPYCTCELLGKPDSYAETRHLDKTLEPFWGEEHIIDDYALGDNLSFTVLDRDKMGSDDSLGRVILDFREFDREDGFDGELKLRECGKGHRSKLKVQVEVLPPALPDAPAVTVPGSRLNVTIVSASGLRAADIGLMGGKSDPFCCCEIRGRPDSKFQTRHLSKTLEPVWNETNEIDYMEQGDNLEFAVYDYDKGSAADLLGRVTLLSRVYDREGGFDGELRLKECGRGQVATLKVKVDILPPKFPDAPPISQPGSRLKVVVIGASGLSSANSGIFGGASDPYCVLCIPGKEDSECQTRHIDKTLDPLWNEDFEVLDYVPGDDLEFRVLDYNKIQSAVQLGKVTLPSRIYDREGGFDGDIRLKESKSKAFLKLKVDVLPPLLPDAPPVSQPGSSLLVLIRGAVGLRSADVSLVGKSSSDPYCKCEILGKPDSIIQTRHLSKTLEPQWEEEHEVETFDRGDDLVFNILDYDAVGSHDFLGKATLHSRAYDREGGFDGDLRLRDCGKGRKAFLNVRVQVIPPDAPDGQPPISQPGSRLKILIHSAVGLRAADFALLSSGTSDPFCVCRIPGKEDAEVQTQHLKKTLDPVWNEEHEIDEYDRGDDLEFVVMDYDMVGGDDLLGRRTLPSFKFDREGGFDGEIKLKECGKGKKAVLRAQVVVLPPLVKAAPPISEPGSRLRIKFLSASGLRAADTMSGSSDPFCRCEIVGKSECMIETRHIEKSLDPVWDEERMMNGYEQGDRLKFQVFDFDRRSSSDLLGRITLNSGEFDREGGFRGLLKLKACGKKNQASLRVEVTVLPSVATEQRLLEEAWELEKERRREEQELAMMDIVENDTRQRYAAEKEWLLRKQEEDALDADRRAKEQARRLAEEEAARKAAAKARAEAEATEILLTVAPVFAPGEILAEVHITAGSTVDQLSSLVFATARLPIRPRLMLEDKPLAFSDKLIDLGVKDEDIILAEMCAVLTTSKDNSARVWDALTGRCLYTLKSHTEPVCMACSVPTLKLIATCSMDETAKLWIVQGDVGAICLFTLRGHSGTVNSIAFSPDLKLVVTASDDRTVKIWSVKTGECKRTFEGHRNTVLAASFTPDGMRLSTQAKDGISKIFEVDTGRCTDTQREGSSDAAITSASATACDGRIIVNASDKAAKVFDVTGDTEHLLEGHTDEILSVAIIDVTVPTRPRGALMAGRTMTQSLSPKSKSKAFGSTKKLGMVAMSGLLRATR